MLQRNEGSWGKLDPSIRSSFPGRDNGFFPSSKPSVRQWSKVSFVFKVSSSLGQKMPTQIHKLPGVHMYLRGPGSSVGIATDYGVDGPGSNPGGDEIFRSSRPAVGPTQPPVKWVPGLSRG